MPFTRTIGMRQSSPLRLAYYVAAAHDPFNTTINSNGSLSGQPGVNERFSRAR